MDRGIENKARELKEAILKSEEYQNHQKYIQILREDPELYKRVNELRKTTFILQNGNNHPEQRHRLEEAATEFEQLRRDGRVEDFLQHELDLCRLLQQVNRVIYDTIDLGIEFF
ncbi:MAG: YlbF family regulator [Lachnospiraceae bacterium]|nr:YlbF family regulator [Lachnospiraceae bacterium]